MHRRVAHEQEAGVIGDMRPFVEIEGDRIGALDSGQAGSQRLAERRERAEGPVDMKPQAIGRGGLREFRRADRRRRY